MTDETRGTEAIIPESVGLESARILRARAGILPGLLKKVAAGKPRPTLWNRVFPRTDRFGRRKLHQRPSNGGHQEPSKPYVGRSACGSSPDPVVLAIADKDRTVTVHEDAVRSSQHAFFPIAGQSREFGLGGA